MDLKSKFKSIYPDSIFLDHDNSRELETFLKEKSWIQPGEKILKTEKPGEGNMNFVLRVITNQRSFILKQSRPWVQKYPQVEAPIERVQVEYNFYRFIAPYKEVNTYTPSVIGYDASQFMLALEDLGSGADYTYVYNSGAQLSAEETKALTKLISVLHKVEVKDEEKASFDNQPMKALNFEHIFVFPYMQDNGFNLDDVQPGLQALSLAYKQDKKLQERVRALGEIYLQNYDTLLHGDYYPGSWLKVESGLKLIDPEFSYFGKAEFDLGVMLAHFKMARQSEESIALVLQNYEQAEGFDEKLMWSFAGAEMIRRLIGLAQLPLSLSLEEKAALLEEASTLIHA